MNTHCRGVLKRVAAVKPNKKPHNWPGNESNNNRCPEVCAHDLLVADVRECLPTLEWVVVTEESLRYDENMEIVLTSKEFDLIFATLHLANTFTDHEGATELIALEHEAWEAVQRIAERHQYDQ